MVNFINKIRKRLSLFFDVFYSSLFWGTTAAVFIQGSNFLINIMLARILGTDLGQVTLLLAANSTLQTFCLLGLNVSPTIIVSKYVEKGILPYMVQAMYAIILIMTLFIGSISVFIEYQNVIDVKIWNTNNTLLLCCCIIWLLASSIDSVQVAILLGLKSFRELAMVSCVKGILSFAIILPLSLWKGVVGVILGYALGFTIGLICNLWLIRKKMPTMKLLHFKWNMKLMKKILNYSLPVFFAAMFISPALFFANSYIYSDSNGKLYLSVFYIAYQWLVLIQFFPTQIAKVMLPLLSSEKIVKSSKTEKKGFYLSLYVCLVLIIMSFIFNKFIIEDIYKFDYNISRNVFNIMCLAALFSTFNLYYGNVILASGKFWHRTVADAIMASCIVLFTIIFFKYYLILALPLALLLAYIIGDLYLFIIRKLCIR